MYTLRKSTQWLADEAHVKDECGPFVSKEGTVWCAILDSARTWLTSGMIQGGQSQIGRSSFICIHE
jgi:hypothetical protein